MPKLHHNKNKRRCFCYTWLLLQILVDLHDLNYSYVPLQYTKKEEFERMGSNIVVSLLHCSVENTNDLLHHSKKSEWTLIQSLSPCNTNTFIIAHYQQYDYLELAMDFQSFCKLTLNAKLQENGPFILLSPLNPIPTTTSDL